MRNINIWLLGMYDYWINVGSSGSVMVSQLDQENFMSKFEFHWVPHSFGLVSHQSKEMRKLLLLN